MIVEGTFADIDGVWHGQIELRDGVIIRNGRHDDPSGAGHRFGRADRRFGDDCLVFAGMGDIHIHARDDATGRERHKETFATAAAAALNGGVVHVADMPNNVAAPVDDASYAGKQAVLAAADPSVHFTLYAGIGPGTRPLSRPVPYKAYMGPSVGTLFFRSLEELDTALARYQGCDVSFHCEDPVLLDRHAGAGRHEDRRPPDCELSATAFALQMIAKHRLRGKLCHYSVGEGLELIRRAKADGLPVTIEVTPHHVFFDTAQITDANRPAMQMNPPLRPPADRAAMLAALRDGTVDYLATDHAPHTVDEKSRGVSGQPHLDTYGAFVTWLLMTQRFAPERIAEVCSFHPGSFVNPYVDLPFGRLLPGYRATLTVLNLKRPTVVEAAMLKTKCAWSPFEGTTFPGSVEAVLDVRGQWHAAKAIL